MTCEINCVEDDRFLQVLSYPH